MDLVDELMKGFIKICTWLAMGVVILSQKLVIGAFYTGSRVDTHGLTPVDIYIA